MVSTVLSIIGQIASLAIAITVGRKYLQPGKALIFGVLAGLATSLATGFAVGFLGYAVPLGQLDFWLASKLMDLWSFVSAKPIGG